MSSTRRTRGDEPAEGVFCSVSTGLTHPNLMLGVLVQISRNRLLHVLLMLLVGHHNFEISSCRRYSGLHMSHMDPKIFFAIFLNGQIHVHFELARPDFGDYISDMMKIPMQ